MNAPAPFLVGLAGGSGSGKSALAASIALKLSPLRVSRLAHDAYYLDGTDLSWEARAARDYDTPAALDQALFCSHLAALHRGEVIRPPHYCFITHRRLGEHAPVAPGEVVLVDGMLLLCDPEGDALLDLRLFVSAPREVRLARRLARDTAERGRTPESVRAQFTATVSPAHDRWVAPSQDRADVVLANTGSLDAIAEVAAALIRTRMASPRLARRPDGIAA